jgi:hypothetical protein
MDYIIRIETIADSTPKMIPPVIPPESTPTSFQMSVPEWSGHGGYEGHRGHARRAGHQGRREVGSGHRGQ